jgi:hypothetical protein
MPDSIAEDMALVLLGVPELRSDTDCIQALIAHRFRSRDIARHLDEARRLARAVRQAESELYPRLMEI